MPVVTQSLRLETDWTSRGLKKECASLKERILHFACASPAELADYWPGGPRNKVKNTRGKWIYCFGQYNRLLGRRSADDVQYSDEQSKKSDASVLAAMSESPIAVPRSDPKSPALYVHPKSFVAIGVIEALDDQLAGLEMHSRALRETGTPKAISFLHEVARVELYVTALIAWIVTTPGPGLPFQLWDDDPQPPAEMLELSLVELRAICMAQRQQWMRLRAVKYLIEKTDESPEKRQRLNTWSGFMGSFPVERQTEFMRLRSLASVLAGVQMHNAMHAPQKKEEAK